MASIQDRRVWIGTRDGLYVLEHDRDREIWAVSGPFLTREDVGAIAVTPHGCILAGTKAHGVFSSPDAMAWEAVPLEWNASELCGSYGGYRPSIFNDYQTPIYDRVQSASVWSIATSVCRGDSIYVGLMPAALFRSVDGGKSWSELSRLRRLPEAAEFWGPYGAPILHSILLHPTDPAAITVGISVAGVFSSSDSGATWAARNEGIPRGPWVDGELSPDAHRDIHKLAASPIDPERLFCTHHSAGLYRSDDGGRRWTALPLPVDRSITRPLALHPRDPDRLWVLPIETGPPNRCHLRVLESHDAGRSFHPHDEGLPHENCNVFRDAMAADRGTPAAIYVGTSRGEVFQSFDDGSPWRRVAAGLPPVRAIYPVAR